MSTSPMSRTLKACREMGRTVAIAEHWSYGANRRVDLFGFIDIVALDGETIVAIQATTGDHHADRVRKIIEERTDAARLWVSAPSGAIEVWSWAKRKNKKRTGRPTWTPRIQTLTLADFDQCST